MVNAGSDAAKLMHTWIHDEFVNIMSKRDQGISNLEEEWCIRQELQLPEFSGSNLNDWIFQLEDSFHFFQLDEEVKLEAAIISLDGDALQWFEWENQRRPYYEWEELKAMMMQHFSSSSKISMSSSSTKLSKKVEHQNFLPHAIDMEGSAVVEQVEAATKQPTSQLGASINPSPKELRKLEAKVAGGELVKLELKIRSSVLKSTQMPPLEKRNQRQDATRDRFGSFEVYHSGKEHVGLPKGNSSGGITRREGDFGGGYCGGGRVFAGGRIDSQTTTCGGWNGVGGGFAEGGYDAHSSGGGSGYTSCGCSLAGGNSGGKNGRHSWMVRLQKISEVECGRSFVSTRLGKILEVAGKGNLVKAEKADMSQEKYLLVSETDKLKKKSCKQGERKQGIGPSNLKPTSFNEVRHFFEPIISRPIPMLSSSQPINFNSKPTQQSNPLTCSPIHPSIYRLPDSLTPQIPSPFQKHANGPKSVPEPKFSNPRLSTITNPPLYMLIFTPQSQPNITS